MAQEEDIAHAHDVSISYAHVDADHDVANARAIANWLENEGYKVWWDRSLLAGDKWLKALVKNATCAKRVILLWSPQAAKRDWVMTEARIAAAEDKLVPLIIEEHPIPAELADVQFRKVTSFEDQKTEILKVINLKPSSRRDLPVMIEDGQICLAGLPTAASTFIGRDDELGRLGQAWASTATGADASQKTNVFVLHAIGGAGKSALMRQFLDQLADEHFTSIHKVYGWSAYSQGSGDNRNANAEEFIAKALGFFGHDLNAHPIQDAVERGRRLAHLVGRRRTLLILDGLEPLQDAPHVNGGRLRDRGLAALITGLAAENKGLLLITSRQELPELAACREPRSISRALDRLDAAEGVKLLAALGVHGKRTEMERAVDEVLGHALSLNLLGAYLDTVHGGDANQREQFKLGEIEDAPADFIGDATARYAKRAARVMEDTIARFEALEGRTTAGGDAETAIMHMVGLFDRPAEREALDALLAEPAIPGLTDAFLVLNAPQRKARWNVALDRLRKLKLLNAEDRHLPGELDAHPIVRAHFGARLKAREAGAFTAAHSRLYDFYRYRGLPPAFCTPEAYGLLAFVVTNEDFQYGLPKLIGNKVRLNAWLPAIPPSKLTTTWEKREVATLIGTTAFDEALKKFLPDDLGVMRPCFSAVVHGCAAGRHQEAFNDVYWPRIARGVEGFLAKKLGAMNADLSALASFFDEVWSVPARALHDSVMARVLGSVTFALRALGRLREAVEPSEAGLKADIAARDWGAAAWDMIIVSELRLSLGDLLDSVAVARTGIAHANNSGNDYLRQLGCTTLAAALHQVGLPHEAQTLFERAEVIQAKRQPTLPKLYSLQGYLYCDLLLGLGRARAVIERANYTIKTLHTNYWLLGIALDNLSLGRAHTTLAFESSSPCGEHSVLAQSHLDAAVDGLRRAGHEHWLPWGLFARATFRRKTGDFPAATTDLSEAHDIASRGEMRLHLADYLLESARLALAGFVATGASSQRAQAETHYKSAADLIDATGYKRRLTELAAIRACLDGNIPAAILAPDQDAQGRPIWYDPAAG